MGPQGGELEKKRLFSGSRRPCFRNFYAWGIMGNSAPFKYPLLKDLLSDLRRNFSDGLNGAVCFNPDGGEGGLQTGN